MPPKLSYVFILSITLLKAIVTNLFSLIGIFVLWLLFMRRKRYISLEFVAICCAAYILILLVLFIPYLQENYNITRLYLQLFAILTIPAMAAFWFMVRYSKTFGPALISIVVALILLLLTGFLGQFTGGSLQIITTQPNGTFDTFYVYDNEEYAAKWLNKNREKTVPVFADTIADLRLQSYSNIDAHLELFPATIPRKSYVYLIDVNTKREHSYYPFNNSTLSYNTPIQFLNNNKNLIYSAGGLEIFR